MFSLVLTGGMQRNCGHSKELLLYHPFSGCLYPMSNCTEIVQSVSFAKSRYNGTGYTVKGKEGFL